MEKQTQSPQMKRQRKFYMILPCLALPFLTLLFWSLGGGNVNGTTTPSNKKGLNLELPDASFEKEKPLDKMSYYDHAASDSAKLKELMKNDPYYNQQGSHLPGGSDADFSFDTKKDFSLDYSHNGYRDPNEAKVYQKLEQLNAAMNNPPYENEGYKNRYSQEPAPDLATINKLEQMMTMNQNSRPDPEMQQINSLMESILDLQHPERVQEKLRKTSELKKGQVYAISKGRAKDPVTTLKPENSDADQKNGFYSFNTTLLPDDSQNAVSAVVHENQTIVNGSTVKLRLTDDIYVNGVLIPKDNFIYGLASLNGERLIIQIDGIRYHNSLYPVSLSVYDLDGLDGIYIPGAISRDVSKSSADRSMQNIGIATLDPSLGVQAAGAGIEAAKSLLSKKIKQVKVMVKAGYQVLLKDEKQKQEN
ncbi:MAG TPA: conjugative transposon protein TraM [Pedobacter sp.]|jgi:conjugative transposon TraM protein